MEGTHYNKKQRTLTGREREILGLIAKGKRNKEIAQECHITENTVKGYSSKIFYIMGVSNRTEATYHYLKMLPNPE